MNTTTRRTAKNRRNRRRDHSLRIKASLILCLLVLFFAGVSSMSVSAGAKSGAPVEEKTASKVYTSYTVCQGDTLYSIAKENCDLKYYDSCEDYILEIKDINHISTDKIYYGRCLTIPRYM